jgi:hypothetical protein
MRKAILIDREKHAERGRASVAERECARALIGDDQGEGSRGLLSYPSGPYDHDGGVRGFAFTAP